MKIIICQFKIPFYIKKPIILPPERIKHEKEADSILGSIIGSAVFDMIGVGVKCLPDGISKALLLRKMNITWSHPRINSNNRKFVRSTPTDDTSQSILILKSIVDSNTKSSTKTLYEKHNVNIDPSDFVMKMIDWIQNGHKEHRHYGALDVGISTLKISKNPLFRTNPIQASEQEWIKSGRKNAANGSVMRIATSGCFAFWDELVVVNIAECFSKVTYFDPRCVFSAISAALLISRYIQWNSGLNSNEPDIDETIDVALHIVTNVGSYSADIRYYTKCKNVEDLKLSENNAIGYCLKALGAGIWALRYCKSIEEGIVKVTREGGDADTNGAVVGALLGAKFGFNAIPEELIKCMFVGQWLFREIDPFMKLMGIKMPPSPYLK